MRILHQRLILVPLLEADRSLAERADAHAGAANSRVDPGVADSAVDLRDAHIDLPNRCGPQCVGRADLHAFSAQDASARLRVDVWGVDPIAADPIVKSDAARRADLAAQTAADTSLHEGCLVRDRARQPQLAVRLGPRGGRQ